MPKDFASVLELGKLMGGIIGSIYVLFRFIFEPRLKSFVELQLKGTNDKVAILETRMVRTEEGALNTARVMENLSSEVTRGFDRMTRAMEAISQDVKDNARETAELIGAMNERRKL